MDGTDIIVIGAGASGMTAALAAERHGARVVILEKALKVGGTAAVSGGIIWAPMNDHMADGDDDRASALAYFGALGVDPDRRDILEGFVDHAAEAIRFVERETSVRFTPLPGYPDYYGDRPGARTEGGRALDSGLFAFTRLGEWADHVLVADVYPVALAETPLGGCVSPPSPAVIGERLAKDERGFGQALVGGLLEACLAARIDIRRGVDVAELVRAEGHVGGVRLRDGSMILATRGVIVATGGFEWNDELAKSFLRGPIAHPASPPGNNGDGLKLAMAAGAALGNMTSAWWCPTMLTGQQWDNGEPRATPVLIERTLPGSIIVNRAGRRFCNEAVNYSAIEGAFHAFDPNAYAYPNMPAWMVFDHAFKTRWPIGSTPPGEGVPDWMTSAASPQELGRKLGIDGDALALTVARFNHDAALGADPDFQRGVSSYDHFYGDRSRAGALATLGPLVAGPYYAIELHIGVLGTNGGAKTDADGRVIGHDGETIPGLYAVGNVMAGATGGVYAGAGGTLGPAMTYGYLAGRHAARGSN